MPSLDPANWDAFRALAHRALDDAIDGIAGIRESPAWQPVPDAVKSAIDDDALPLLPSPVGDVYAAFQSLVAPYAVGNRHPRFFGWVHGAGSASGMLAEMLAASLDVNAGGRDHAAVYIERRVIAWFAELFGFPQIASGIITSGTSMANFIALLVARRAAFGTRVRQDGVAGMIAVGAPVAYTSVEAHESVADAFDVAGIGSDAVRRIAVDDRGAIDIAALRAAIAHDRERGFRPIVIVGSAGSASIGAVDDLGALADIASAEQCWFHVDGAFGALAIISPSERPLMLGIERADSIAFDFHKWLHVPYDAGCVLVRNGDLHRTTFADEVPYLARLAGGAAGGDPWYCDYGPELSRSFRALKVWFTVKEFGLTHFGALIEAQCAMARELAAAIGAHPNLELLAPVSLNVVAFRWAPRDAHPDSLDELNLRIVVDLQERGIAVPSTTRVNGKLAIRMNIMNHRTTEDDIVFTLAAIEESAARVSR